ncbi:MAG: hypothetical protein ACKVOI_09355 [Dongiaceae bacterium]
MLTELLAGFEGSALAVGLRGSKWVYPLVNAGHIAGIALLFGAIAGFDLRLMSGWPRVPLEALAQLLVPVAAAGLALAALCGSLLFIVKATEYAASSFFQAKMAMLVLGLLNIAAYRLAARRAGWSAADAGAPPAPLQRLLGAVSFGVWLSVLVLGRLVGYF